MNLTLVKKSLILSIALLAGFAHDTKAISSFATRNASNPVASFLWFESSILYGRGCTKAIIDAYKESKKPCTRNEAFRGCLKNLGTLALHIAPFWIFYYYSLPFQNDALARVLRQGKSPSVELCGLLLGMCYEVAASRLKEKKAE